MNTDDGLLVALAAEDPARGMARVPPPPNLLRAIMSEAPAALSPRSRRTRVIAISAPVFALVIIGIVVGAWLLRPTSAFATWSAEPGAVDPAFAAAMQRNCALGPTGSEPSLSPETRAQMTDQQQVLAQLPLVAMDQRGRAGVALFAARRADGQASVLCMTIAAEVGAPPTVGGGGSGTGADESPPDGPLRLFSAQRNASDAGTFTAYAGSVGPRVARVIVVRSAGSEVVATVSNGYFLVWWPGEASATSFVGHDPEGAVVAQIGNNGWDFASADEPGEGCLPFIGMCFGSPARTLPPIDTQVSGELIETGHVQLPIECRGLTRDRCTSVGAFSDGEGGVRLADVERVVVSCYGRPCTEAGGAFRIDVVLRAGGSKEIARGGFGEYKP